MLRQVVRVSEAGKVNIHPHGARIRDEGGSAPIGHGTRRGSTAGLQGRRVQRPSQFRASSMDWKYLELERHAHDLGVS